MGDALIPLSGDTQEVGSNGSTLWEAGKATPGDGRQNPGDGPASLLILAHLDRYYLQYLVRFGIVMGRTGTKYDQPNTCSGLEARLRKVGRLREASRASSTTGYTLRSGRGQAGFSFAAG